VARTFVFEVQPTTEARYRVREQLANLNFPSDAVGVTNAVTGKLVLNASGHVVPEESRIVVDLRQLRSDSEMRDNYLRRTTLQTSLYPAAEFAVKELAGLPWPLPASGELPIQVAGDLTIRGVTRPTMWDAVVTFNGDEVSGLATTSFRFADFGMRVPTVLVVLSVEDNIRAELDFRFRMLEQ
jgi:polyisoprenoid-binding protein YceI